MRNMQLQIEILGTNSAFAYRETKKNLCRGGQLQNLTNTDFQPGVVHLKKKNVLRGYRFRLYSKVIFRPNTKALTYTESVQWIAMSYHSYATRRVLP